jgi:hypothetical protein
MSKKRDLEKVSTKQLVKGIKRKLHREIKDRQQELAAKGTK